MQKHLISVCLFAILTSQVCRAGVVFLDQRVSVRVVVSYPPTDREIVWTELSDGNVAMSEETFGLVRKVRVEAAHQSLLFADAVHGSGQVAGFLSDGNAYNTFEAEAGSQNLVTFAVDAPTPFTLTVNGELESFSLANSYASTLGLFLTRIEPEIEPIVTQYFIRGIINLDEKGILAPGQYRLQASIATALGLVDGPDAGEGHFSYQLILPEPSTALLFLIAFTFPFAKRHHFAVK